MRLLAQLVLLGKLRFLPDSHLFATMLTDTATFPLSSCRGEGSK